MEGHTGLGIYLLLLVRMASATLRHTLLGFPLLRLERRYD